MPPNLDIYGLTKYRDLNTINTFLDLYVDRAASEDRGDEDLMLLPLFSFAHPDNLDDYDWEPARTLSNIIQRGLDFPRRSFSVYLKSRQSDIDLIILSFTSDNQLILGLSIDYWNELPETLTRAERLLKELAGQFNCHRGLIMVEGRPPVDEKEFLDPHSCGPVVGRASWAI
jgi:hypothetical protein